SRARSRSRAASRCDGVSGPLVTGTMVPRLDDNRLPTLDHTSHTWHTGHMSFGRAVATVSSTLAVVGCAVVVLAMSGVAGTDGQPSAAPLPAAAAEMPGPGVPVTASTSATPAPLTPATPRTTAATS